MSLDDYKLSAELLGHSLDVRAVASCDDFIVSGSRDKTAKIWERKGTRYEEKLTLRNHKNFVASVCVLENGAWICTGSNDSTICVYSTGDLEPFAVLRDHSATVSALAPGIQTATLLSGSWDKTARVWTIAAMTESSSIVLEGHEAAVWAVVAMPCGQLVTGSADKNIIYWNARGERLKTLKGHKDCVRGLLLLPNNMLASVGNDAVIRLWDEDGECVRELSGHSNYIYSIASNRVLGDDVFVTCGEDSTMWMWNMQGALGGPMILPAQSVWSVTCLGNGDIVTATSDGVVRIFSRDPSRVADQDTITAYNVAAEIRKKEATATLGGVKVSDLPGPEALLSRGKDDQTKMIRHNDGNVMCYQWTNGKWNALGDVVGAAGGTQDSSGKKLYEGEEYDYVFDVDVTEDAPPIKLPYNVDEDPYTVAQKFIHKHNLPQGYLDQVANFIITNSAGKRTETATASGYQDPFTGGARYVPGGSSNVSSSGMNVDPFTGGSSYSTQSLPQVNVDFTPRSGQNADPFTGGSSYSSSSGGNNTSTVPQVTHFPYSNYLVLDTSDSAKVLVKLKEFNAGLGDRSVAEEDLEKVMTLCNINNDDESSVSLLKELLLWPTDKLFPVLDIIRLAVRQQNICTALVNADFLVSIVDNINHPPGNQLMSIRCLSNMMQHGYGRGLVEASLVSIFCSLNTINQGSTILQNSIAALYLNLTISQLTNADQGACQQLAESILIFLGWVTDPEATYRGYRALGNLLSTSHGQTVSALIVSADVVVERLRINMNSSQSTGFVKINEIARDIINAL